MPVEADGYRVIGRGKIEVYTTESGQGVESMICRRIIDPDKEFAVAIGTDIVIGTRDDAGTGILDVRFLAR